MTNFKNCKFICTNTNQEWLGHSSCRHCEICHKEPAILQGCDEGYIKRIKAQYALDYPDKWCINCNKKMKHYFILQTGRVAFKTPTAWQRGKYCSAKCGGEYNGKKHLRLITQHPEKHCEICKKIIDKKKYKDYSSYIKAKTCGKRECIKRSLHNKNNTGGIKFGKPTLLDKFAQIDRKYEA